jgi:hypothetical protein
MWVCGEEASSPRVLPFDHCRDEHDSLAVFLYRDPRMLIELVDRRMVMDISEYFDKYTRSRLEPPSFLVTPDELQSYIHLPTGEVAASLHSLRGGTSTRQFAKGNIADEGMDSMQAERISSRLVRLEIVPRNEEALEETAIQPLAHLADSTVRTFELVYTGGETEVVLSAESVEDMRKYARLLTLVYGGMKFEAAASSPAFLRWLPAIVGFTS